MSPILIMLSGIVVLILLPTLLEPGVAKQQKPGGDKRVDSMLERRKLTSKQLSWVVERCVDYKLRATDLVLLIIAILNVSVLFCILGLQNDLLNRITQVLREAGPPPSYFEATQGQNANLFHNN